MRAFSMICFAVVCLSANAMAHPHDGGADDGLNHNSGWVHENGVGPDPDGDTNPATISRIGAIAQSANEAGDDPPYSVITFEPPPGGHGDLIGAQYQKTLGAKFSPGLTRQICVGQRHFYYDSICTYKAAPSGRYAAGYDGTGALIIEFNEPVCVVTTALYPTGGKEGEEFTFTIDAWTDEGRMLTSVSGEFAWTNDTVRWRNMAGAFYLDERAAKVAISLRSSIEKKYKRAPQRFLIDDVAFTHTGCQAALAALANK